MVDGHVDRLLTVNEVAARLDVSAATVYKLCAVGDLAHVRVLNTIRVTPRDLDAFIAKGSMRASTVEP